MVNSPKQNYSPLLAGKNGKSIERSTKQLHQANECKNTLEAESVRALGEIHSLRSKKKLSAKKPWEAHFLSHEDKEKWIQHYLEREPAGARK